MREHNSAVNAPDFVPHRGEITTSYAPGEAKDVRLHDGGSVRLRKLAPDYDPGNRRAALDFLLEHEERGEILTGLLYVDSNTPDLHDVLATSETPFSELDFDTLCPGLAALERINESLR